MADIGSDISTVLGIGAVVVLVIFRQFRAQRIDEDNRWWVLPAVLAFVALREPGLLDAHHQAQAVALLAAELVVGVLMGIGWGLSTRVWRADDGSVWAKGSRITVAVWLGGIALRAGLYGAGAALGLKQGSPALMLALAVTLVSRTGVQMWRAGALPGRMDGTVAGRSAGTVGRAGAGSGAYRVGEVPSTVGKDRM